MAHAKAALAVIPDDQPIVSKISSEHCARVQPEYVTVVNPRRKFVEVSPAFCKLLGYSEVELVGRSYDEFTVPRTNDIQVVLELFLRTGYMHGIWVFTHRSGTKLFVRYESFIRDDGLFESHLELLGAGA